MTHADVATLSADPTTDAVTAELEAMHAIAAVLARVRDPRVRLRVLRWATDRFQPTTALHAVPQTLAAAGAAAAHDPTLAVETLYELFDMPAADDALDEVFEMPERQRAPVQNVASTPDPASEPRKPREEPARLDTLVRGFAAEFQRLAVEWQRA